MRINDFIRYETVFFKQIFNYPNFKLFLCMNCLNATFNVDTFVKQGPMRSFI